MNLLDRLNAARDRRAQAVAENRTLAPTARRRRPTGGTRLADEPNRAARLRWLGVDTAAVMALLVLVTIAWLPSFGGGWVWVASLGGSLLGIGTGTLGWWRRWNAALTSLVAVGAYAVFGTVLAMPSSGIAFVVPTLRSLTGLLLGPVYGWKGLLTVQPPIGETTYLLVPVVLTSLVASLAAMSISARSTRPALAFLPLAGALILASSFGTTVAVWPVAVGIAAVAVILVWTSYRRAHLRAALTTGRRIGWLSVVAGALVLALAGGIVAVAAPAVAANDARRTFRTVVTPPLDVRRYPSPLQSFKLNLTDDKSKVLFTVTGAPQGTRIRIATMDAYDGYTYNVSNSVDKGADSGEFRRIGEKVDEPQTGTELSMTVTMGDLASVWVPTVGQTRQIQFGGDRSMTLTDTFYYNQASGTAITPTGLQRGDRYALRAVVKAEPTKEQIAQAGRAQISQPPATPIPDVVRDLASKWAATTAGATAQSFNDKLKQGYYSTGIAPEDALSLPGHTIGRLDTLFRDTDRMVGDEEQYAVAMALLSRAAGMPARVVYGYVTKDAGTAAVKGADVSAWTEVYLGAQGWVTFDPTPPHDRKLPGAPEQQQTKPRPQVENPPPPPQRPEQLEEDNQPPVKEAQDERLTPPINWRLVGTVAVVGGIPLIFIVAPMALIIGLKMRRRNRRLRDPDIVARVAGGWAELVDRARDLGVSPTRTGTRTEQAEQLRDGFERVADQADPRVLARQADATVFSPDVVNAAQAATYWSTIDDAIGGMNRSVGLFTRLKATLSTKSFRRYR